MAEGSETKVKYLIVVVSGLSDVPSEHLSGKTPLEGAHTPNMDFISANGRLGLVETMVEDLGRGSDKALLSLLGYDPTKYPIMRGPLEAAGIGLELDGVSALARQRCHLVPDLLGDVRHDRV